MLSAAPRAGAGCPVGKYVSNWVYHHCQTASQHQPPESGYLTFIPIKSLAKKCPFMILSSFIFVFKLVELQLYLKDKIIIPQPSLICYLMRKKLKGSVSSVGTGVSSRSSLTSMGTITRKSYWSMKRISPSDWLLQ